MSFLDFKKHSLKEHIDIIIAGNNPFGGTELSKNDWRTQYSIDEYIVFHSYEVDSFDIQIYSIDHDERYSFKSNKYYEVYNSPDYNYTKNQTEFTQKNFTLNDVVYIQNFYDDEQYKCSSKNMTYNKKIDKFNRTMQTLYSKFNGTEPYRDFQIIERKKDDFIYTSNLTIYVESENKKNNFYVYIDIDKINSNSETEVRVEWDNGNKVLFNLDTPDASILHLYNPLTTFQAETALSSTEYYYFKIQLKQFEEILMAYKSEMPIISTVLHNIEVVRNI